MIPFGFCILRQKGGLTFVVNKISKRVTNALRFVRVYTALFDFIASLETTLIIYTVAVSS